MGTAGNAPAPTPVAVRAGEAWIAFQQFGSRSDVTLVRQAGSDLHRLVPDLVGGDQTNPDWSPDGTRLVFAVVDAGRDDLWVANADGTGPRRIIDCESPCLYLDDPAWSPDGTSILFSRMHLEGTRSVGTLERFDLATAQTEVVVTAAANDFYAGQRWSPDGRSAVVEVVHRDASTADAGVIGVTLAIIDLAAPTPEGRGLTAPGTFPEAADWLPDGSGVVFGALAAPDAGGTDLFAIDVDGSNLRRLTMLADDGGNGTHPDVAADGASVVFAARLAAAGPTVLATLAIDGGEVMPAAGGTWLEGVHPRWRPLP